MRLTENSEIIQRGLVLVKIPKTGTQSLSKAIVSACAGETVAAFRKYQDSDVLSNQSTEDLWPWLHNFPHVSAWTLRDDFIARRQGQLLSRRTAWDVGGLVLPKLQSCKAR